MTELDHLTKFLKTTNTKYMSYYAACEREFIADEALRKGAVVSISVRDSLDFAFDIDGKLVGTYTNARGSWKSRKDKK